MSPVQGKAQKAMPPRGGCHTPVPTKPPPCRPPTAMPCGWVSPMWKKRQAFRAGRHHLAWPCCCPEQTLVSPQVAVEICLGTPGPDRSVATEENKTQFGINISWEGKKQLSYNNKWRKSLALTLQRVFQNVFFNYYSERAVTVIFYKETQRVVTSEKCFRGSHLRNNISCVF